MDFLQAEHDVELFLAKDQALSKYTVMIEKFQALATELVVELRPRVPLNLIALNTTVLQQRLSENATLLASVLISRYTSPILWHRKY